MIAFFVAPAAMFTIKGGRAHRRWGKIYFWMMAVVAVTAMVMAIYRPIIFLAFVAIFSFYFAFRGYRSVLRKREGPASIDWIAVFATLAGSLALIALGIHPVTHQFLPAPVVSIAFGITGTVIAVVDIRNFLRPSTDRNAWWYSHMGGMLGSYIATLSAFSAVNFFFLPIAVRWLWPSVIGIPGIFLWTGYYRTKFARGLNKAVPTQI
jgi:hypothetical protein